MKQRRMWDWCPIVHHILIAASLTSMVFLAKQVGMTAFLDGLTINVLQTFLTDRVGTTVGREPCIAPRPASCKPALITISSDDYHKIFHNTSPLRRDLVADGLEKLFQGEPAAVMIDLDFSPSASGYKESDRLDGILDEAAKREKIKLILITPLLDEISGTTEEWLQQRCLNGVGFAFNSVASEFGIVFRYSDQYPSLGVVAKHFIPGLDSKEKSTVCSQLDLRKSRHDQQSQQLDKTSHPLKKWDEMLWRQGNDGDHKYVRWLQTHDAVELDWHELLIIDKKQLKDLFGNRLVFVGSRYDPHDVFQSPLGPRWGVETHMAVAYSQLSEKHILPYAFEVVVGTIFGSLGAWCWQKHHAYRKEHVKCAVSGQLTLWHHIWKFGCRGMLFVIPALTGLLIVLVTMRFSVNALAEGVWINPVPLAVGIFLDLLVSHDHSAEVSGKSHDGSQNTCLSFVPHPSVWLIQIPLIACGWYLLVAELLH